MIRGISLLNANASYGVNVAETPDFRDLRQLVAHLDRLGVDQAVVWNQSCIPQAREGNRRLVENVTAHPEWQERLVPALVVAPTMLYQRGAMDDLHAHMRNTGLRALRSAPRSLYHDLRHLEPVLEELQPYSPVLMIDIRELQDTWAVLTVAERFPDMSVILTDTMWTHMTTVFDLMRRCPTIRCEISWVHSEGTVALLAKEFGAHRVIFGMGPKSHAGAAIAGLLHSGLGGKEVHDIARGNMARLLGLPEIPAREQISPPADDKRQLWPRFLSDLPLQVHGIDAHAHVGAAARWVLEEGNIAASLDQMRQRMDRYGIATTIIFPGSDALADDPVTGNRVLEATAAPHGARFRGCLSFHPAFADELRDQLDDFFSRQFFVGFKLLCGYWNVPLDSPLFIPVWEYANRHRLFILMHTWSTSCDSPALLRDIAPRYPDARFILGHSGGSDAGRRDAVKLALANPNVYLEWCGSFCSRLPWEDTLSAIGNDRIVFGTDAPYHSIAWELGRLLSQDIDDAQLIPILGHNMQGVLQHRQARADAQ